ncbi:hypothetical protein GCM10023066_33340 [Nocardioides kongjuensis]
MRAMLSVLVVSVATLYVAQTMSEKMAIRDARARGEAFARGVAAPLVTQGVRDGDPAATEVFARVMANRIEAGSIVHMKLWSTDGTVIWSDETALIGRRFELEEPMRSLAGGSFSHAELSDLSHAENELEAAPGHLLEVYVGAADADGVPLIFETYWSAARIHDDERRLLWTIAPLSVGSMLLLLALVLPIAVSLARSANRSVLERNRLLRHALGAADLERSRIAQVLHDGVVQDLAGLGYALPSAASRLARVPDAEDAHQIVVDATELVRRDLAALRTLLVDIYPPSLALGELANALDELAVSAQRSGTVVSVDVRTDRVLGRVTNQLAYRIVREGLLNVVKHAGATRAWVVVRASASEVEVSVRDDGRGLAPERISQSPSGHLGLRLLRDAVVHQGGELTIGPALDGGTVLRGSFPVPDPDR